MKTIKSGSIVSTTKHYHKMTVHELLAENKVTCHYFIGSELHTETHDLKDLTVISG